MSDTSQVKKLSKQETILAEIIEYMNTSTSDGSINERHLQNGQISSVQKAILRATINDLEHAGFLIRKIDNYPPNSIITRHPYWILGSMGIDFCENVSKHLNVPVPAADRFVSIGHNSQGFSDAISSLSDLAEEVRKTNVDLTADPADKLAIYREVENLKSLLEESKVRVAAIITATRENGILHWLAVQTASGTINALASQAIKFLLSLLPHK